VTVVDNLSDNNVKKISKFPIYDFMSPSVFLSNSKSLTSDSQCVFHQGAITDTAYENVEELMRMNYSYTRNLLLQCVVNKTRIVYASSAAVYGDGKNGFKENVSSEGPLNVYGFSKLLIDNWLRHSSFFKDSSIFGLRYFNVYGMGEEHKGNMSSPVLKFFKDAGDTGSTIKIFEGSEGFYRDFVSIEDIVKVNISCGLGDITPGIYNVGSGKKISFLKVAEIVRDFCEFDVKIEDIRFPDNLKGRYQANTHANLVSLRKAGYKDKMIYPESGIKKYLSALSKDSRDNL
jgi:ADP-L-glycero-D-manno-heptose 6-epimerase